ncbi:MAG: hypothetical protein PHG69_06600, partial [Candidatus Omnitrophica bacterium]|nr:hypothetical protein [Candidatus Omnitrophota bacterium]
MFKKILIVLVIVILVTIGYNALLNFSVASFNYYKDTTYKNYGDIEGRAGLARQEFKSYRDWLWHDGRTFSFDIIYMNLFSPGTAGFSIKEDKQI